MLQKNLDDILGHAQKLNELDTEGVEPTSYILKQQNVVRETFQAGYGSGKICC